MRWMWGRGENEKPGGGERGWVEKTKIIMHGNSGPLIV